MTAQDRWRHASAAYSLLYPEVDERGRALPPQFDEHGVLETKP